MNTVAFAITRWLSRAVTHLGVLTAAAGLTIAYAGEPSRPSGTRSSGADPKASEKDLLPPAPNVRAQDDLFPTELAKVPEVALMAPLPFDAKRQAELHKTRLELEEKYIRDALRPGKEFERELFSSDQLQLLSVLSKAKMPEQVQRTANVLQLRHIIANIRLLNDKKADYFIEVLAKNRPDVAGLPFIDADARRVKPRHFGDLYHELLRLREHMPIPFEISPPSPFLRKSDIGAKFWDDYARACAEDAKEKSERDVVEFKSLIRVTGPMQVLATESINLRMGLVKYLAGSEISEATRSIGKLAIFSIEKELRNEAIAALKERPKQESADFLLQGLRYPWPAVAKHAAEAIAQTKRSDLVPQLIELLDEPDPTEPVVKNVGGMKQHVIREVVRINHHRNCLLCHAPGDSTARWVIGRFVPIPSERLPREDRYLPADVDGTVRADVTYLRQDFSMLLPVDNHELWPKMQRYDFLVRTRVLANDEEKARRESIKKREAGYVSPHKQAIVSALRALTGRNAEPTAKAWQKVLAP